MDTREEIFSDTLVITGLEKVGEVLLHLGLGNLDAQTSHVLLGDDDVATDSETVLLQML